MDQFLTLEKANVGPVFNSTAYYIYIYIYGTFNVYVAIFWVFQG